MAKVVLRLEYVTSSLTIEWFLLSNSLYSEVNKAKKERKKKIKGKEISTKEDKHTRKLKCRRTHQI